MQSMSTQEMLISWYVKEWISLWSPFKLVQNSLPIARTTAASSQCSTKRMPKATSTLAKLTKSHETSIVLDEYIFTTAMYEGGNDDAKIGRICKTASTAASSVFTVD
jgi:hypothetical protein